MMGYSYDNDFGVAVRNAAIGKPNQLAEILRSGRNLGRGERQMLAALIEGRLARSAGAPSKGVGAQDIVEMVERYRQLISEGGKKTWAAIQTGNEFGKSERTVRCWDKKTTEREAAVSEAISNQASS